MTARSIAGLALTALVLTACADATSGPSASATPPGSGTGGTGELVLRWGFEGGFTPPGYQLTNLPAFSLYDDGTIVRPGPQIEIYPPPALPSVETLTVDLTAVDAIVQAAFDADLDTVADMTDMGTVGIADAPETVFTLRADGVNRTVRVYALGGYGPRPPGMPDDEWRARKQLSELVDLLGSLERWLPEGSVGPSAAYEASGARVFVSDHRRDADLPQPAIPWPLEAPLDGIGEDTGMGFRCVVVSGPEWTDVLAPAAAGANQLTPWRSGGERYAVAFRPLLPDETTC